jgi:DNA gyrase/topoisomerase IV subunit B
MRMRKKLAEMAEKERAKTGDGDAIAPRSQPLPAKLSDCESKDRKGTELFIVEGDSAAGPALMSRNPALQAVLPIRGKGLNVEKAIQARQSTRGDSRDRIANNVEVQSIIASVGAGSESKFDLAQTRFSKIIILTDADDDGAHIATLLLTTFYHLMRPMLEDGRIYVARPPLFSTIIKDEKVYAHTIEDRDRIDRESRAQLTWTRFKGLGEMNPDELGETAIDPKTRRLAQISMSDVEDAAFTISQLMGKDPAPKWAELSTVTVSGEEGII